MPALSNRKKNLKRVRECREQNISKKTKQNVRPGAAANASANVKATRSSCLSKKPRYSSTTKDKVVETQNLQILAAGFSQDAKGQRVTHRTVSRSLNKYCSEILPQSARKLRRRLHFYMDHFGGFKDVWKLFDVYGTFEPSITQLRKTNFLSHTNENGELRALEAFIPIAGKRKRKSTINKKIVTPVNTDNTDNTNDMNDSNNTNDTNDTTDTLRTNRTPNALTTRAIYGTHDLQQRMHNTNNTETDTRRSLLLQTPCSLPGGIDNQGPSDGIPMHMSCADESNKLMMLAWKHRQSCSCRNTGANDSPIVTEELTKKKGGSATQIVKCPNCLITIGRVQPVNGQMHCFPRGHNQYPRMCKVLYGPTRSLILNILKGIEYRQGVQVNTVGKAWGSEKYYKLKMTILKFVLFEVLKCRNAIHRIETLRQIELNTIEQVTTLDVKWDFPKGTAAIAAAVAVFSQGVLYTESIKMSSDGKGMNRVPFINEDEDDDYVLDCLLGDTLAWKGTAAALAGILSRKVIKKMFQQGMVQRYVGDDDDGTKNIFRLEFDIQVLNNAKPDAILLEDPKQIPLEYLLHLNNKECTPANIGLSERQTTGKVYRRTRRRRHLPTGVGSMTGLNATSSLTKIRGQISCLNHSCRAIIFNTIKKIIGAIVIAKQTKMKTYKGLNLTEIEMVKPILISYASKEVAAAAAQVFTQVRLQKTNSDAKKAEIEYLRINTTHEAQQMADQRLERSRRPEVAGMTQKQIEDTDAYFLNQRTQRSHLEKLRNELSRLEVGINNKSIKSKRKKGYVMHILSYCPVPHL